MKAGPELRGERTGMPAPLEIEGFSATRTAALAALLHRCLHDLRSAQRPPDLPLLRAAAAELQARLDRGPDGEQTLQRLLEWLEWDAPRFA